MVKHSSEVKAFDPNITVDESLNRLWDAFDGTYEDTTEILAYLGSCYACEGSGRLKHVKCWECDGMGQQTMVISGLEDNDNGQ